MPNEDQQTEAKIPGVPALSVAPSSVDGAARLCAILYGRKDKPRDWLGGSNAMMIHDAVREIERLRVLAAFCEGVLSIVEDYEFNVEGVKEARRRIADALSPNTDSATPSR